MDDFKKSIEELKKSNWYKDLVKLQEERSRTIKTGDNVIHLGYLGGLLSEDDIVIVEKELDKSGVELSRFDRSGLPQASFEDYLNVVFIAIQAPLIYNILNGVATSAVWEGIKFSIRKVWKTVRNKNYTKVSANNQTKKQVTFGVEIKLDKNTGFNFRLDGDISDELIDKSLDKALDFIREQKLNDSYKHSYFVTYSNDTGEWSKLDIEEEIRKE